MCPKCKSDNVLTYWDVNGKTKHICNECKHKWED